MNCGIFTDVNFFKLKQKNYRKKADIKKNQFDLFVDSPSQKCKPGSKLKKNTLPRNMKHVREASSSIESLGEEVQVLEKHLKKQY